MSGSPSAWATLFWNSMADWGKDHIAAAFAFGMLEAVAALAPAYWMFVLLLARERVAAEPILPLPLFRSPRLPKGVTITAWLHLILSIQPRSKKRWVTAAPSGPAICGRRSVQSRQSRQTGRRAERRAHFPTGIANGRIARPPALGSSQRPPSMLSMG